MATRLKLVDRSGTITSGGSAQEIMAVNQDGREYLYVQNNSDTTMWVNFGIVAVASQPSIRLLAGESFEMSSGYVSGESVSVIGAVTGKTFTAKEG